MAAIEITVSGVLYDKLSRTTRPVVLIGEASLTGLGVGGGPSPGGPGGGGGDHIWGGGGVGNYPDAGFPGPQPGGPTHIWGGGGVGNYPDAGFPVPQPPNPFPKPPEDGMAKPPPPGGGWGYSEEYGWGFFPKGQSPSPKG